LAGTSYSLRIFDRSFAVTYWLQAVAISIGLFVLAVGFLRILQTETGSTFTGNLSWIPYVICAVLVVGIAFIAVKAISRGQTPDPTSDKEQV